MNCKLCHEQFDHSKHKPFCLLPCVHTFCGECLKKSPFFNCPICSTNVTGKNPNWGLIQVIPESTYDKLKSESLLNLSETNELKKQLESLRETKSEENKQKINQLRDFIISKADELIKLIETDRDRLLDETKNVEDYLNKKLNESKLTITTSSKFQNVEAKINENELNEIDLDDLNNDIKMKKFDFSNKINELEKLDNSYELKGYDLNVSLGDIANPSWISNPTTAVEHINLGKIYHEQLKNLNKTLSMYDRAIELNSNNAIAYRNKGLLCFERKDYKLALECYDKAIELDPTSKNGYIGKSNVLKALKYYHSAIECFDQVIKLDQNHVIAYYSKGNVMRELKKYNEAIDCYNKAIEINKFYTNSYYSKGLVFKEIKDYSSAIECFNTLIEIDPFYINAYLSKGYLLRDLKRYEEALANFDKCLELNSNFTAALNSKNNLLKIINKDIK